MMTPDDCVGEWLQAAGFDHDNEVMRVPVLKAGEFLQNNGELPPEEIARCLGEIDFRQGLVVVRLPASVLVRPGDSPGTVWLTDTGLSVEFVKPIAMRARRELLTPMGPVPALRAAPVTLPPMTPDQLFHGISPATRAEISRASSRGAHHYLAPGSSRLRVVR